MRKSISLFFSIIAVALTVISCSSDDDTIQSSSLAEITDFSLIFKDLDPEEIEYNKGTNIKVTVPFGTSLNEVIPIISISDHASVLPASGEALDFVEGEPTSFIVTAQDGGTKEYTVTILLRNEVGSGSKLKTYSVEDAFGENATSSYTYTSANFVKEIHKEADNFGEISTVVTAFEYNNKNQIIAKYVAATNERTNYSYEEEAIVKAEYAIEGEVVYTYEYAYDENGNLSSQKRIHHQDNDRIDEINFVIENGNVIKEIRYGEAFVATYDDKNNPFIGMYPSAYASINAAIEHVNTNNPIEGTIADDRITYLYNESGYPISATYTYFEFLAAVTKNYTYYEE